MFFNWSLACSGWLWENDQSGVPPTAAKCWVAFLMHRLWPYFAPLLRVAPHQLAPKKCWQLDVEISCEETTSWRTASGYLWRVLSRVKIRIGRRINLCDGSFCARNLKRQWQVTPSILLKQSQHKLNCWNWKFLIRNLNYEIENQLLLERNLFYIKTK